MDELVQAAPARLPREYVAFLRRSNGVNAALAIEPGWLQLWPAEDVLELNDGYGVSDLWPDYFAIGSNGGGELLLFKREGAEYGPVVMIPCIPLDRAERRPVCPSFTALISALVSS